MAEAAAAKIVQKNAKGFRGPKPKVFDNVDDQLKHDLGQLALAYRVMARLNLSQHVAGHITLRDPKGRGFWVSAFGTPFARMRVSNLLLIDDDGNILEGGGPDEQFYNRAGFVIHHAIHQARPDVNSAVHSHTTYGKAWSILGQGFPITTQDSCSFYKSNVTYDNFGGVVVADEEGKNIAKALGETNKLVILQNHGLLTTGGSVESALAWFIMAEAHCESMLLAYAAAQYLQVKPIEIGEEEAQFTAKFTSTEQSGWLSAFPYMEEERYHSNGDHLL